MGMGMGIGVTTLIAVAILFALALPIILIVLFFKLIYKLLSSNDTGNSGEEVRMLQSINTKLNRLEKRIESLESIVVASDNPRS